MLKAVRNSNKEGESLLAALWFLRELDIFFLFFFGCGGFLFCLYFFLLQSPLNITSGK